MSLRNKKVLIAGIRNNIGTATAYFVLKEGGTACISSKTESNLIKVKAMLSPYGKIEYVTGDVNTYEKAVEVVNRCAKLLGGIDNLVVGYSGIIEDSIESPRGLNDMVQLHLSNPINVIRASLNYLGSGSTIVILLSIQGVDRPSPEKMSYSLVMAGLSKLVEILAQELMYREIRIVGLAHGDVDETFIPDREWKNLRKLGSPSAPPEDYAKIITWLLDEDSEWINGTVILADGGFRLRR